MEPAVACNEFETLVPVEPPSVPQWYLIHCKPREDARAVENLERQGFECYWPTRRVEHLRDHRRCVKVEPLFPRYLFIRLDQVHDNWYVIRSTRGVSRIVRFNDYPLPVRDHLIDGIRARLDAETRPVVEPYLRPGDRVHVTDGAFDQVEAIFLANDGDSRVVLLLNLLHTEQQLSFPVGSVRKITRPN